MSGVRGKWRLCGVYGFQSNSIVDLGRWELHVDKIG